MQDILNKKELEWLNSYLFRNSCFKAHKQGLSIRLDKDLKAFFKEYQIFDEISFSEHFIDFRDNYLYCHGLYEVSFCWNNDELYPNHFGLTQAPIFGVYGQLGVETMPPRYVYMFSGYCVRDWVKELIANGEVYFDWFIDNTEAYNAAYHKMELELNVVNC